ncbi:hypothetical protein Goshw_030373, partial [Gossypium schwendimanii]|nr:hypothetical protein [Gossypium schwendimanii]
SLRSSTSKAWKQICNSHLWGSLSGFCQKPPSRRGSHDYKTPDGAAPKSPSGRKYDVVIHCASGIPWSTFEPNLSSNGKVIDITPGLSAFLTCAVKKLTFSKKKLVPLQLSPKKENLNYLVNLVKDGKLKTVIDSKYPLSKAEEAWAKSMDGHATGKIIVET